MPIDERRKRIAELSAHEAEALLYDWNFWSRPNQKIPAGDEWRFWLVRAGRGFGKTRVGAETVRMWVRTFPIVNLIGPTAASARDVMIEGESGILSICPPSERPEYLKGANQLRWPNGARSLIFSADEPERLRGPQCFKLWADELAAWRYPEAWDLAMLGLRLGVSPQAVVTTTPKPIRIVKELVANPSTIQTRGTTYDNRTNLAASFYTQIITKYEGTRLGRQELNAEILDDNPNAMFTHERIEADRVRERPASLNRIVVAIDPAVTSNEDSDETGIMVCGVDGQNSPHFYVLEDLSGIYTPTEWGTKAVGAFKAFGADRILGEVNNGGDMVEMVIRNVDVSAPFRQVRATRGKEKRAEPIQGLYEQHRVHHVGCFPVLEDQMCDFNPADPNQKSPDHLDALVWALAELSDNLIFLGLTNAIMEDHQKLVESREIAKVAVNDETLRCPLCQYHGIANRGPIFRCSRCGHEWGRVAVEAVGGRKGLLK